ncbi:MAG TPA: four helix bundle protein [Gemmatimonadaceae bacterium]|nr:four helix bundle protein [Gemmatimonadaceae bacterium]
MQDFRKLTVWRKSHELVLLLYRATARASEMRYPGLVSQLRRSASSIPANIAEGRGRSGPREFARFLQISLASAHELHYHILLASDLGLLSLGVYARLDARTEEIKRMLTVLLRRVSEAAERAPPRRARPRTSTVSAGARSTVNREL